jgi:zinc protease
MARTSIVTAAVILLMISLVHAQPGSLSVTKMGNGLTVLLLEDHAAELVAVGVWVRAGSATETEELNGVSHFIEHLAFGSTRKHKAGEMDVEMESIGATLDAHTTRDYASYTATVSSRYLAKALELLADAVTGPLFNPEDVESEKRVILDEITKKLTNPIEVCKGVIGNELYGSHPYALPIEGMPKSVRRITSEDIRSHFKRYYTADNMAVVLVGDFDPQTAISAVGKSFQAVPKSSTEDKVAPEEIKPLEKQIIKSYKIPVKLNYLAIGFLGPPATDTRNVCAIDVLLTHLGCGYRSWMEEELKQKMGLALSVEAEYLTHRQSAAITLIATSPDSDLTKLRDTIMAKIAELRKSGMSPETLVSAKRSLAGDYAFQNETYAGRANSLGFYWAISDPEFGMRYLQCTDSVTNDEVIHAAQKYLDLDKAVIITLGPNQENKE